MPKDLHYIRDTAPPTASGPRWFQTSRNPFVMKPLRKNPAVAPAPENAQSITPKTGGTPKYWEQPVSLPEWGSLLALEPLEPHILHRHRHGATSAR